MYEQILKLPVDGIYLEGRLTLPVKAKSVVIFVEGTGEHSEEYKKLSKHFQKEGFGTLLFGLSQKAGKSGEDTPLDLLSQRLIAITLWLTSHSEYRGFDIAYFGAGTGAAVAMTAAVELNSRIRALVSCGGHTELVDEDLEKIVSPTLLIAGELDFHTIKINEETMKQLQCPKQMAVVAGASHLFEEAGKLELVAKDSVSWFHKYMRSGETVPREELKSSDVQSYEES